MLTVCIRLQGRNVGIEVAMKRAKGMVILTFLSIVIAYEHKRDEQICQGYLFPVQVSSKAHYSFCICYASYCVYC